LYEANNKRRIVSHVVIRNNCDRDFEFGRCYTSRAYVC
jgi:hypothetical protein